MPAGSALQQDSNHHANELELDDDELLELVGDLPQHMPAAQQQPPASANMTSAAQQGKPVTSFTCCVWLNVCADCALMLGRV